MIYPNNQPSELINEISKEFLYKPNRNFNDFLDSCLFALESKEKEYMEVVERIGKEIIREYSHLFGLLMNFFYIEQKYWDVLGEIFGRVTGRNARRSDEFYTPFHICRFMVSISDPKPGEKICDPCVGSGAFLIAVKEYWWLKHKHNSSINLYGMDISPNAIKMAKIQNYLTNYNYMSCLLLSKFQEANNESKKTKKSMQE